MQATTAARSSRVRPPWFMFRSQHFTGLLSLSWPYHFSASFLTIVLGLDLSLHSSLSSVGIALVAGIWRRRCHYGRYHCVSEDLVDSMKSLLWHRLGQYMRWFFFFTCWLSRTNTTCSFLRHLRFLSSVWFAGRRDMPKFWKLVYLAQKTK